MLTSPPRPPRSKSLQPVDGGNIDRLRRPTAAASATSAPTRRAPRSSSKKVPSDLARDRRDRGRALLRAQRNRLRGRCCEPLIDNIEAGEVEQGGSTLTMQLMRNLCISDPERDLERKIVEAKLALELREGALEAADPRPVPEHRLLRHDPRPHRGRRPGRREDLLLEAGLEADPRAVGAARRPAAGALRVQPAPQPPARRSSGATRCSRRWPTSATSPRTRRRGVQARAPAQPHRRVLEIREPYFFDYVEQKLIEEYGVNTVRQGGLEGPHDDRPASCRRPGASAI